ncbi:GNAT family N-acetyltransferase [Paramicrobacterium chengjingii]
MTTHLATLSLTTTAIELRRASMDHVSAIIALLADDPLGASRESTESDADLQPYREAFNDIDGDPRQLLVVAVAGGEVVGTMQLTFIPGLSRRGALRAQIEAVRVRDDFRGLGLGQAMFGWAIGEAQRRGCVMIQLTADKTRTNAHRFYTRLGFVASHEGFKLDMRSQSAVDSAEFFDA